jgi:hypothetical protein
MARVLAVGVTLELALMLDVKLLVALILGVADVEMLALALDTFDVDALRDALTDGDGDGDDVVPVHDP